MILKKNSRNNHGNSMVDEGRIGISVDAENFVYITLRGKQIKQNPNKVRRV